VFKQYFQATWEELWAQERKTLIYRRPRFTAAFSMFPRAAVNLGFTVPPNNEQAEQSNTTTDFSLLHDGDSVFGD
jgi:transposase